MEVTVLKGEAGKVRHFAEHVIAERGVLHGRPVIMPDGWRGIRSDRLV